MGDHALFAPSAAHRWSACPGSAQAEAEHPDRTSEPAAEGTFAHEIAARCLEEGSDASDYIGERATVEGFDFMFTQEMAGHLQVYLDVARAIVGDARPLVEHRVTVFDDLYGTADVIAMVDGELHVIDLKFGRGERVRAEENRQLLCYAWGAILALSVEERPTPGAGMIHMHIVQPRCPDADGTVHRTWSISYSSEEFGLRVQGLKDARRMGLMSPPPRSAGAHCKWCDAAADCPTLREQSMAMAAEAFGDGKPSELAPDRIAEILDNADTVEEWLKAVRQHARKLAENGVTIPGYRLEQKLGNRKWNVSNEEVRETLLYLDVDPDTVSLVSPAEAEKRAGRRRLFDAMTSRASTGHRLVRGETAGPPATPFTNLEETNEHEAT